MIDKLDLDILQEFDKLKHNEERKLSEIVKRIFKEKSGEKEYILVRRRIINMANNYGFFEIGRNSQTNFTLDSKKVYFRRFTMPTRRARAVALEVDGKWQVFEL